MSCYFNVIKNHLLEEKPARVKADVYRFQVSARSAPRVQTLVYVLKLTTGDMRIYLRGGNVHMPKHDLNGSQIRTALQQVAGK